jgi:hypothetical protein
MEPHTGTGIHNSERRKLDEKDRFTLRILFPKVVLIAIFCGNPEVDCLNDL